MTCPLCQKEIDPPAAECPRCRADVSLLADHLTTVRDQVSDAAHPKAAEVATALSNFLELAAYDPNHAEARIALSPLMGARRTRNWWFMFAMLIWTICAFGVGTWCGRFYSYWLDR